MSIWRTYTNTIKMNCSATDVQVQDISYWRNNLFANIIIYLLPLCLIALIPGLYYSIIVHKPVLVVIDVIIVLAILMIGFVRNLHVEIRKIIFAICTYTLSGFFIYYLGLVGPGLLFLFAACIFFILVFSNTFTYYPAIINTLFCIGFGIAKWLNLLPWLIYEHNSLSAWIAVSSNLIFLSFLASALIPKIFIGLQNTIDKERALQEKFKTQQQVLQQTVSLVEQKNTELEQFAYVASHDLQEPLRMIASFLQLIEKKYYNIIDDKGKQYIFFATDGAKRMQQMIMDLLEYSRAGRKENEISKVDINEIITEIKFLYSKIINEKKAVFIYEQLPTIYVSKAGIKQVFQNIISNALKYTKTNHHAIIEINFTQSNNYYQFSICDNGIGIAPAYHEQIFNLFQRLHQTNNYKGTGLGLAITKKIIEQMGGTVGVHSIENHGSEFYFTIPVYHENEKGTHT